MKSRTQNIAWAHLRIEMLRRGVTTRILADGLGYAFSTVSTQLAKRVPQLRFRARVEMFLNVAIWSKTKIFKARCALRKILGRDPALMPLRDLELICCDSGAKGWLKHRRINDLILLLAEHARHHKLEIHPKKKRKLGRPRKNPER